jgi:hypothetical protein
MKRGVLVIHLHGRIAAHRCSKRGENLPTKEGRVDGQHDSVRPRAAHTVLHSERDSFLAFEGYWNDSFCCCSDGTVCQEGGVACSNDHGSFGSG